MAAADNLNQDQFKVYFASKNDLYNEGDVAPAGFPNYDASGTFGTEGKPWFTNPMEAIRPIKVARRVAQLDKKPVADADEVTLYEGTPQGKVYTYSKGKAGGFRGVAFFVASAASQWAREAAAERSISSPFSTSVR